MFEFTVCQQNDAYPGSRRIRNVLLFLCDVVPLCGKAWLAAQFMPFGLWALRIQAFIDALKICVARRRSIPWVYVILLIHRLSLVATATTLCGPNHSAMLLVKRSLST